MALPNNVQAHRVVRFYNGVREKFVPKNSLWFPSKSTIFSRALLLVSLLVPLNAAAQPATKQVLILCGCDPNHPGFLTITQTLRGVVRDGAAARVEFVYELQEGLLKPPESPQQDADLTAYLKQKYQGKQIDLILALVAPRLRVLLKSDPALFTGIPKVAFDFESEREPTLRDAGPLVTGVWARVEMTQTLELALALQPDARQVIVVAGNSAQETSLLEQARTNFRSYESRAQFSYVTDPTLEELQRELAGLPRNSIVFFLIFSTDKAGHKYPGAEALIKVAPNSAAPLYGSSDSYLGAGIVGGSLINFEGIGKRVGEMSVRLLNGDRVENIPPETVSSVNTVDWRELRHWGLSEDRLPAGTIVRFRQPTFGEQYKWYAIVTLAVLIFQGALIGRLLFAQSQRRRAEKETEKTHRRLKDFVSNVPGIVWEATVDPQTNKRKTTFISGYVKTMLGYTPDEWLAEPPGLGMRIMVEADRDSATLATEGAIATGKDTFFEHRWRAKDGRVVWAESHLSPILNEKGKTEGLRGVTLDITERKLAEATAERTEEKDRAILEAMPDLMFLQTRDGVYLDLHCSDADRLIVPPTEYFGKNMRDILPANLAELFQRLFQKAIETGETQIVEYELTVKGERRWFESRLVRCGENILSVVRDITESKAAEEVTMRQARHAAMRADVSSALAEREIPLQAILQRSAEAVVQHLDAALARIWKLNKEAGVLELQASAGLYTHLDGQHSRVPVGALKIGMIAKEGRPHLTNNVVGDPRVNDQQWARDQGMVAFAGYPLKVEERLVGVIAMFAQHRLTEDTIEALASVADTIAQGIERRQTEAALRESEERLRMAQEAARVGTWEWHLPTGNCTWSEMIWELLGIKPGDRPSHVDTYVEFIHPEDRERCENEAKRVIEGSGDEYYDEYRIVRPGGLVLWIAAHGRVFRTADGTPDRIIGVNVDITKRKAAEETARDAQQKDAAILNAIPDLMFLHTRDGVFLDYHAKDPKDLLVPPAKFLGKNMREVLPPDLATKFVDYFKRAERSPEPQIFEYQLQMNGRPHWYEARIVLSGDNVLSVVRDITERIAALNELRQSEERFGKAFRANPQPMSLTILHTGRFLDINESFVVVSGYSREELLGRTSLELGIWETPETRAEFVRQVEQQGSVINVETTLCRKDGTRRTLLSSGELVELGGEQCLLVASSDITERNKAVNELRKSEERFAKAFRANPQPMTLTALADGRFVDVNDAFLGVSGYNREEVIGHSALELDIWETPADRANFIQLLKDGGSVVNVEKKVRAKDGSRRLLLMSADRVELGGQECVLVASTDITERKRAEEALHESEEKYRTLFESIGEGFCVFDLIYDEEGRAVDFIFRVANPAFERQTGWHNVVGLRVRELAPNLEEYWFEKYAQVVATGAPVRFTDWAAALNRWYEVYAFHVGEEGSHTVAVIFSDVSERIRAEQTLQESEARFRNLADTAPVLIWISDPNNLRTYVNQQWLEFTGRTAEQEMGSGWVEGIHPEDRGRCLETYAVAFERHEPFRFEYRLRHADGKYRWVFDSGTPRFSASSEFLGFIGSCMDITSRKESEQAVLKAHEQLMVAHDEVNQLKAQLEAENVYLRAELGSDQMFGDIVGESEAIQYVLFKISQVAATDSTVLITGETGTGKELVARAIHSSSRRSDRPLITVNCAALPATLIESELFGHEKGAFTGAAARKPGRFELANGGTIFLDEIGELPLESQVKLMRVLQEGEIERLGGSKAIKVDVRIIAATNRNLKSEIDKGTFREELWYRLNVFPITVPPLRQRKGDIPLLVEHFVSQYAKKLGKGITSISPATMERLETYTWPGNVRELANIIERAVIFTSGSVLHVVDVFESAKEPAPSAVKKLEEMEREYIVNILEHSRWRIEGPRGAAKLLGLNPSTLRTRMIKLGIQKPNATASGANRT